MNKINMLPVNNNTSYKQLVLLLLIVNIFHDNSAIFSDSQRKYFWLGYNLATTSLALYGTYKLGANIYQKYAATALHESNVLMEENSGFEAVAGTAEAKEELQDIVDYFKNPDKFSRLGAKVPLGVLLVGAPGNGKTLLARALAGEANCFFYNISGSEFINKYIGVGAARVRELFAHARQHAPSIVFIDEIDAIGARRSVNAENSGQELNQTLNQLLIEMDGFRKYKCPVIVVAATNRPEVLDEALLRSGRFDRVVVVPYPDLKNRISILKLHMQSFKIDTTVDLHKIAQGTIGFSGADLASLINEAAISASKKGKEYVEMVDFEEARDKMLLGNKSKTTSLTEEDRKITAYHEAGHALITLMLPNELSPLHKVTITPRGNTLGVTYTLPEREKYSKTKTEMLAEITMCFGGRVAEEMVFNQITTAAYSDFASATDLVLQMVCLYGMSEEVGFAVYRQKAGCYEYSQKKAEQIDAAVVKITATCYQRAKDILTANRDKLDKLADALLAKETLNASEIYPLLEIEPRVDLKFADIE